MKGGWQHKQKRRGRKIESDVFSGADLRAISATNAPPRFAKSAVEEDTRSASKCATPADMEDGPPAEAVLAMVGEPGNDAIETTAF